MDGQIARDPDRPAGAVGTVHPRLHAVRGQRVEAAANRRALEVDVAALAGLDVVSDGGAAQLQFVSLGHPDVVPERQALGENAGVVLDDHVVSDRRTRQVAEVVVRDDHVGGGARERVRTGDVSVAGGGALDANEQDARGQSREHQGDRTAIERESHKDPHLPCSFHVGRPRRSR